MKPLDKKLLRDLWHLRGQVIATALVVACGVASFVSMRSMYNSLLESRDSYYRQYGFADVFTNLKRAPDSVAGEIAAIPGVAVVQTRVVAKITLDIPDLAEPAQGQLVSISPKDDQQLNRLYLIRGRMVEPDHADEVLISGAFAEANSLSPGDQLAAVINNRLRKLHVVGIALSPEYIYEIRPGDIFPDNKRFGIVWINRRAAAAAFQMENAFNDVSVKLEPQASEAGAIEAIDRILERYGGFGAYGRSDQFSHRFVSNELAELQVFGTVIPAIFLGVVAFLLHLVLSRLINVEREQIGLLKAFGYSNADVGLHYLKLAVIAIAGGVVAGILLGAWMGSGMNALYAEFFRFPIADFRVSPMVIIGAVVISTGAAAIGAASAVLRAVSLPPAEAMRPEPPANFHAGIVETSGMQKLLSTETRIIVRNLVRQPVKALLSAIGIALSIALLFIGFYFFDAIIRIIDVQFYHIQREDVEVSFIEPRPGRAVYDLAAMPGVLRVEPYRVVPARIRSGNRVRRIGLFGLSKRPTLRRVIDKDLNLIHLPPEGIVIDRTLAESLAVEEGAVLTLEVTEGTRPVRELNVVRIVDSLLGTGAYMEMDALSRLMNEGGMVSGAFLSVDRYKREELYSQLKSTPGVSGVSLPDSTLESFNETMAKTIGTSTTFLIGFACVIAFGVVYNGARIALAERGRELASLRVLGFTQGEVGKMLLGEQAAITAVAIPIGWVAGFGACLLITKVVDADIIRLPMVVSARTFLYSAGIVALAALFSGIIVAWRIRRMDLIAVLKTRE
ncbi:MAG TPA: FtsX-like permease family protein [Pyrinomonadaceae bacterium]|nr:FtsX-like permease family protein [Pyrinomonadaceae bacterium]HMP64185.1 FtsX-like permease family protein [Pyrinomonadaceae bacterium]